MNDPLNGQLWRCEQGDVIPWLASLPEQSVDLVFGSPPYCGARLYLENGEDLGIARDAETWTAWMVEVVKASLRVCKGLVAFVVDGQTKDYRYDAAPALLMADLHRAGIHLRKPPIYRRVGIPGSGGPDWLRNDWEWIICATNGGKLPWSDNTAMGHPPKWAPGGEMSHRLANGARVNAYSMTGLVNYSHDKQAPKQQGIFSENLPAINGDEPAVDLFGEAIPESEADPWDKHGRGNHIGGRQADGTPNRGTKHHTKRRAGKEGARSKSFDQPNGTTEDQVYVPPVCANPGNVINELYTAEEVAEILGQPADIVDCKVGGGQMGSALAHLNEAPFTERLTEFFIRSFAPENGIVVDPFSGSGTTGAVVVHWGRRALCCDLRLSQVELSRRRIKEAEPGLFTQTEAL